MAASSIARAGVEQGGWPSEVFEPGEEAKAEGLELACAVCCLVMREPMSLACTSDHHLCCACAERLVQNSQKAGTQLKCPIDREVVNRKRFRPAGFVSRRINELQVHCRFQARGCEWKGDLGSFAAHAERCEAGWGVCGCCGARFPIDELAVHEAACRQPCPNAERGCTARLSVSELEPHLGTCLENLVVRFADENRALKRRVGDLSGRVEDLSEELRSVRRRAEAEAPAGQAAGAGPPAAASSSSAAAGGAQAARAGQGPRELRVAGRAAAAGVGDQASGSAPGELRVAPGQSVMEAVRRAAVGQTIRLAPGLYREQVVLGKEVHLVGPREAFLEWSHGTALSCKGAAAPSVRGITIRGQWAIEISGESRALVENCDVSGTGTGIVVSGAGTAPTLRGNTVHGCGGAGVALSFSARGAVEGNDLCGNGGDGIAIFGSSAVVRGNWLHDQPRGISVFFNSKGTIEGNAFERIADPSYAPGGGLKVEDYCTPVVQGNAFRA